MSDAINTMARVLTDYRCKRAPQEYKRKQASKREHHADGQLIREHHVSSRALTTSIRVLMGYH